MKKTLIFDHEIEGHHLEYIHHLYNGAELKTDETFVFLLNDNFKSVSKKLLWKESNNVKFEFLSKNDIENINRNIFLKPFYLCKLLRDASLKYEPTHIFLISLMAYMPLISFFINSRIRVSGIVYLIYLYRWTNSSFHIKILDTLKYLLFSKSRVFEDIFLLNDEIAPKYLNKKFRTNNFKYLPDPFGLVSVEKIKDCRDQINIDRDKIVFLHFGALSDRKGTAEILRAISFVKAETLNNCCFIFAGKVDVDIKDRFYSLVEINKSRTQIVVYDNFCDYDFICSLCISSNYILIPYKVSEQSSGVIGYAAKFGIPIVGPSWGLIGKLVKRNNLGFLLNDTSAENIKNFIENTEKNKFSPKTNYIQERTVINFTDRILK